MRKKAREKFVLCRHDVGEIGERKLCGGPIRTANKMDWCAECAKRLPIWPKDVEPKPPRRVVPAAMEKVESSNK